MEVGVCVDLGMKQVRQEGLCRSGVKRVKGDGMCRSGVEQVRGRVCVDRV